jgi:ribosomal protein S18 acetylase RimI-like enzyme
MRRCGAAVSYTIVSVALDELPTLLAYLEDHLRDNGVGETPLFLPMSRTQAWKAEEKRDAFGRGLSLDVGLAGWRRAWVARAPDETILGHVDLRAHPQPHSDHRALLGIGVHRDHRSRGLGKALLDHAVAWAEEIGLAWIDLEYLATNLAAGALYRRCGFVEIGRTEDMFRIDGNSVTRVQLTRRLR